MIKAYVLRLNNTGSSIGAITIFVDTSTSLVIDFITADIVFGTDITAYTQSEFVLAVQAKLLAYSVSQSYGISADDIIWMIPPVPTESEVSHSIVTGTGATGFQVSASKNAMVNYNVTIATTATIGGSSDGTVVLEIAPTNSASAGDWKEIGRFRNGQAITLALALQSVHTLGGQIGGFIPAGYYAKLRSINNAGTPTYTYNSGQEVLL